MAEIKWIKLTTDMFDNRKIKHLRKLPEGNNIVLIWVMLLTMAGRCNSGGLIFLTENIPYTPKMLADELGFEENTVLLALNALEQFNMVVSDQGYFAIAGWQEHQNIEGMEKIREQTRIRVAKHRENQKQKLIGAAKRCVYCGGYGDTIDHVIAKTNGGLDIPENTVCCCLHCNMQKNNHDVTKFLNDRLLMHEPVDIEAINSSDVLRHHVRFDHTIQRFVTLHVTQGNATEEDKETDKDRDIDKDNKKRNKKSVSESVFDIIDGYTDSDDLRNALTEFVKMRQRIKKPMTAYALKLMLKRLTAMATSADTKLLILNKSIVKGWQDIYPLKNQPKDNMYYMPNQATEDNDDFISKYYPGGM